MSATLNAFLLVKETHMQISEKDKEMMTALGFATVAEALAFAKETRTALRVISTWASVDGALHPKHVEDLCQKALGRARKV